MSGYWKDEEKTAKTLSPDDWLHTGDKGYLDDEGYIFLVGRGDDMVIRGGENISPEEVENVLSQHPKVAEAALIGVPDPEWGQQPRAMVALKEGETATEGEISISVVTSSPGSSGPGVWSLLRRYRIPPPAM